MYAKDIMAKYSAPLHASMPHISYARKMRKNMPHICGIWSIYPAYMRRIFRQIPHILPQKVPHILRKFSAINQHPYRENFIYLFSLD